MILRVNVVLKRTVVDSDLRFDNLCVLSFVFSPSRAEVSAGFTNVISLSVAVFGLIYCSLSVLRFVFVLDISK